MSKMVNKENLIKELLETYGDIQSGTLSEKEIKHDMVNEFIAMIEDQEPTNKREKETKMNEIKLIEKIMCKVLDKLAIELETVDTEDVCTIYGIYAEVGSIALFVGLGVKDGKMCSNGSIGIYDSCEFENYGFYAKELGELEDNQAKAILDFVDEVLEIRYANESIHTEEMVTEYEEILLALDDADEYIQAMKELVLSGINGLPIVSLADECITICKDIENLALENVAAGE